MNKKHKILTCFSWCSYSHLSFVSGAGRAFVISRGHVNYTWISLFYLDVKIKQSIAILSLNFSLQYTHSHKFFGVIFHKNLNLPSYINAIRIDILRSLAWINTATFFLPTWLKHELYYALVHSHLHCCLLVREPTTYTSKKKLLILQKKTIKAFENLSRNDHAAQYFTKHKIVALQHLFAVSLSTKTYHDLVLDPG